MKKISLLNLILISACSSHRVQDQIPPFQKDNVCSKQSLEYLKKSQNRPIPKTKRYSDKEIHSRMMSLEPTMRKCYEDEIARTNKAHSFNLCFIVGYNSKAVMEFFEFSTKEIEISPEFKSCLASLRNEKELQGLKDLTITQPFRLYPKP